MRQNQRQIQLRVCAPLCKIFYGCIFGKFDFWIITGINFIVNKSTCNDYNMYFIHYSHSHYNNIGYAWRGIRTIFFWQSFSLGESFSSWKGVDVLLCYYFDMVVLVHENHDKWPNVTGVHHFSSGFDYSNLVNSFCGSKYLPEI